MDNSKKILDRINNLEDLKCEKSKYYGKNSEIQALITKLKHSPISDKKRIGSQIKKIKDVGEKIFSKASDKIKQIKVNEKIQNEWIDVTIPIASTSSIHPISKIANLCREWLIQNGYYEHNSDEVISDTDNFSNLNINKNHPARDMHDSFYISDDYLLRTHNTGASIKLLKKFNGNPLATFTIGKVYRNDTDDSTHSHQFNQCDLIAIGNLSFANLKWTLLSLIEHIFGQKMQTRIRPSYFPFTEPSLEMDIFFHGKWIEVLGAGMLNTNVYKMIGVEHNENTYGFAAGIGLERLAMIKYRINDIRELYKNDLRFLSQFQGVK